MSPKARLLVMQPQICLAYCIRTHLLPRLLSFVILIDDGPICDCMDYMNASLAHLTG